MSVSLIEGEKILKKTCPHFLSMFHLYLIWGYLIAVAAATIVFRDPITIWIHDFPQGEALYVPIFFAFWGVLLLLPAVVLSFYNINFHWFFLAIALCGSGFASYYYRNDIFQSSLFSTTLHDIVDREQIHNYLLITVGTMGIIASDVYRRSHNYYLTNRRIIARFGFIRNKSRDLMYSKIDDLILEQGILGRIFNFVTIIPISASGMGTGSDQVLAMGGIEGKIPGGPTMQVMIGGGRSVTIPRAPSFYALYGVPSPEEIKGIIIREMEKREYGYTRRLKEAEAERAREIIDEVKNRS